MILGFKTVFPKTQEPTQFPEKILRGYKIHSIREGERWKAGMKIHFATGVRTKAYNQFNSGTVVSTQKIIISPSGLVMIDGKGLNEYTKGLLASNDGFDYLDEFLEWFKKGLHGQIIHWTNYKY